MIRLITTSAVVLLLTYNANSQVQISAEVRPRTEFRNGFKTLTDQSKEPVLFTEQRSRIYFDYTDPDIKFRLSLQDVRVWGETGQIFKKEPGTTFLSEAWGQYHISEKFSVKAGRQIISYDNQRFLGGLEWAQQGRRHDAILLQYELPESYFHFGIAYNQDTDVPEQAFLQSTGADYYSVAGNYKTFQYGYFHHSKDKTSVSLLAFNAGYQNADSTTSFKQTFGFIGSKSFGNIKFGTDLYYQAGELSGDKVNAYLAGINVTAETSLTPITVGVEHISGKDSNDPTRKITAFSPDFGTNHAHNGYMDYFFVGPANGNVGLTDLYIKSSYKISNGTLKVHAHEFLTGSVQLNEQSDKLERAMGTEIDLVYIINLKGGVLWHLGYSQMFATDTMEALRGGNKESWQCWAWTMITFKPTIFTSN